MGILDQIKEMRNQGITDQEIVSSLQEQGISPREISDALDQSRIKQAVTSEEYGEVPSPEGEYTPQSQEMMPETPSTGYAQPQEYYQQDQYNYSGGDSNMIIEISEQVFSEKIKKIQKQVEETTEFKALAETKIDNISERLKRIESTIDRLQMAILNKIGSYGDNLSSIKKEMSMMQDSFGQVINQAVKGNTYSTKTSSRETSKKKRSKN